PYPKTKIITMDDYKSEKYLDVPFDFPVELKPEDPVSWLKCQFEGRKKTFAIQDKDEFKDIVTKIYTHGYKADLILQDFIPSDDYVYSKTTFGRANATVNWKLHGYLVRI